MNKLILIFGFLALTACADFGRSGVNGLPGANGANGVDGAQGSAGSTGATGPQGAQGIQGTPGIPGQNGADGAPGLNSVVEIVDPCGKQGPHDEIFFRLSDGLLYAVYADVSDNNVHLVQLTEGNWVTTDETHCYFHLNAASQISDEHN